VNCIEARAAIGVLVLGALEPWERPAVEAHLAECHECQAVHAELAPLPRALALVDQTRLQEVLAGVVAPPEFTLPPRPVGADGRLSAALPQAVSTGAAPRVRLSRRGWLPVAAAAALLVSAGGVWLGLRTDAVPAPRSHTVQATNAQSHVHAQVQVTPTASGSALTLGLRGVAASEHCQLIAITAAGRREVAATWVADYRGGADVHGSVDLAPRDIARLQVQTLDGRVLVVLPG
jgi:hypothetical protein